MKYPIINTIPVLTVRASSLRRRLGAVSLSRSNFSFEELRYPLLVVQVPHQHPGRVLVIRSAAELAYTAFDALAEAQCADAELADRQADAFSDAELLEVLSDDLFALHIVQSPVGTGWKLDLPEPLRHNFPWVRFAQVVSEELI